MDEEELAMNNNNNNSLGGDGVASGSAALEPDPVETGLDGTTANQQGMSKNAMKKAARKARYEATKADRRAADRDKKKARKLANRDAYRSGTMTAEQKAAYEKKRELTRIRRDVGMGKLRGEVFGGGVVIDLGFDELMTDQEIKSMGSQLNFVYASNRTASKAFSTVLHTSFSSTASPRLRQRMERLGWNAWSRSAWWATGLDKLVEVFKTSSEAQTPSVPVVPTSKNGVETSNGTPHAHTNGSVGASGDTPDQDAAVEENGEVIRTTRRGRVISSNPDTHLSDGHLPSGWSPSTHQLVYLSADAEEELGTLSPNEVYIIGGLVDRNRHKLLCQKKAESLGIRTARLPIGEFIEHLPTRKVLTVNQVFDILVQYLALGDWAKAFEVVIPQRKYEAIGKRGQLKRRNKNSSGSEEEGSGGSVTPSDETNGADGSEGIPTEAKEMEMTN